MDSSHQTENFDVKRKQNTILTKSIREHLNIFYYQLFSFILPKDSPKPLLPRGIPKLQMDFTGSIFLGITVIMLVGYPFLPEIYTNCGDELTLKNPVGVLH